MKSIFWSAARQTAVARERRKPVAVPVGKEFVGLNRLARPEWKVTGWVNRPAGSTEETPSEGHVESAGTQYIYFGHSFEFRNRKLDPERSCVSRGRATSTLNGTAVTPSAAPESVRHCDEHTTE